MPRWTASDVPDQSGRVAVVTGANSGLGYVTARELARRHARVVLACRDRGRGEEAVRRLKRDVAAADVELRPLDMADLASIRSFAHDVAASYPSLDLLVNNAGVMAIPRRETLDGFEMQLGTNHLGHFALTAQLLDLVRAATAPRVVTVSSGVAHIWPATIDFDDLQQARHYSPWRAYAQSKLATLLFALELDRRTRANGWGLLSVAAHPGYARTNLQTTGPRDGKPARSGGWNFGRLLARIPGVSQTAVEGALPGLLAATGADVQSGDYYGPSGHFGLVGAPIRIAVPRRARSARVASALWALSTELTHVSWPAVRQDALEHVAQAALIGLGQVGESGRS
jgi:NAD(P)-dependent dehydrogenase (short-subunit alcohol dehydrogenase family)